MARLVLLVWFGVWIYVLVGGGHYLVHVALRMGQIGWSMTALLVLLLAFVCVLAGLRLLMLAVMLVLGLTTPRLARRDFRNSIANALFFIRTGGMIKDP